MLVDALRAGGRASRRDLHSGAPADLARAIERALAGPGDAAAAVSLADRLTWPRIFEAELADLRRVLG